LDLPVDPAENAAGGVVGHLLDGVDDFLSREVRACVLEALVEEVGVDPSGERVLVLWAAGLLRPFQEQLQAGRLVFDFEGG
jgi:hypothetical protein